MLDFNCWLELVFVCVRVKRKVNKEKGHSATPITFVGLVVLKLIFVGESLQWKTVLVFDQNYLLMDLT